MHTASPAQYAAKNILACQGKVDGNQSSVCDCGRKQLAAGLWRRAEQEGARTEVERRNYGIADDVYAAGLLLAFMAFVPFAEAGSIDAPSLQRCELVPSCTGPRTRSAALPDS